MPTAMELRVTLDKLLRVELPKYLDVYGIKELKRIYNTQLQILRRRRKDLEDQIDKVERRTGILSSRVGVLSVGFSSGFDEGFD